MSDVSGLAHLACAGAAVVAGVVNAIAGGGTLISFPVLTAVGVPAVRANATNTVSLCPGYISGTYAQRADLEGLAGHVRPQLASRPSADCSAACCSSSPANPCSAPSCRT